MDYMTLKEAAEKWGVTPRRVNYYCAGGRIPGAVKMATIWLIPKDAQKPQDKRYKKNMNDSVGLSAYLKREERPLEKLPGEESVAGAEITYQFVFNALYRLSYTFSDPTQITVADRDNALQKFKTEFQNYVDNLSEADLTSSNIKTVLSEKADELENSLSTAKMKLSCEVENVEVHNAGEEIVNN